MKKRFFPLLLVFVFQGMTGFSQTHQFSNVLKIYLRNNGAIVEDNTIKGYYFFFVVEKEDRKNNNYLLQILDENLREVNSTNIVRPSSYVLLESAYNGSTFAFAFIDFKDKLMETITFDKTCKQIGNKKMTDLTNKELYAYGAVQTGEENVTQTIFAVKDKGFLKISPVKKEKMGYDIELLTNELKSTWKTGSSATTKKWLGATFLDMNDKYALIEVNERDGMMDKDLTFRLQCIDLSNGKDVFNIPLTDPKFNLSNSSAKFNDDKDQITMIGEYYALADNVSSGKSLGFYAMTMALDGSVTDKKFISWDKDVSKLIPVNEKGKFDNKAYVFFHKAIHLKDGRIFLVGEQFKKAASGAGIAMMALSGGKSGVSVTKMVTMNMMVFEFDAKRNLTAVKIFEKDPTNISLPAGIGVYPPSMIARYIAYLGQFDYMYSQLNPEKERYTVTYVNYDREKGEKPKNVASTIIYADGQYSVDAIPLSKAKTAYAVFPAKPGYIMISEYAKKEKTLDVRLEKFNY